MLTEEKAAVNPELLGETVAQHYLFEFGCSAAVSRDIFWLFDHRDQWGSRVLGICEVLVHGSIWSFMVYHEDLLRLMEL
ncbi:MAG: hypothetical protein ACI8TL_000573 [Natronomonas sp.]